MGYRMSWAGRLRVAFACVAAAMALCLALPTNAHAATTIAKVDVGNVWKSLVVGRLVAGFVWTNPPPLFYALCRSPRYRYVTYALR